MKWFRLAAERRHAAAQDSLDLMYANGQGVPRDYVKAVKWFRLAAKQGYAGAPAVSALEKTCRSLRRGA